MPSSTSRDNIELIVAWLDAMRRRDIDAAVVDFAPDVVWEGLVPGVECSNRAAVREMLEHSIYNDIAVERLELMGGTEHAVLGVGSPELVELAGARLDGELFNVFTIRDGEIVHVRDFARRDEALAAAHLSGMRGP